MFDKSDVGKSENTKFNEKILVSKPEEKANESENKEKKEIISQTEEKKYSENKENVKQNESVNKIDLFKAIFLSDDESDEKTTTENNNSPEQNKMERVEKKNYEEIIINKEVSTPVKMNLNEVNKSKSPDVNKVEDKVALPNSKVEDPSLDLMYGPKIPDKINTSVNKIENNFFDDNQWIEKNKMDEMKKKRSHKSKHGHKSNHKSKHKHKHKGKHKKKKK